MTSDTFYSQEDSRRDYTIIVDRSASMKLKKRWGEAEHAVKALCAQTCKCDSDGISLYFFSSHSKTSKGENPAFLLYKNVATGEEVMKQFSNPNNQPKGGTDLTKVLRDALPAEASGKPQSILVITDGCPDDTKSAENLIINTINGLSSSDELSLTFIQVGDDTAGNSYLEELDNALKSRGAKFDVVDQVSHSAMEAKFGKDFSFADVVQKSIVKAKEEVVVKGNKAVLSSTEALPKTTDAMRTQSTEFEWGRIRDEDVKTSDFLRSKEYASMMDAVKESSNDRMKVEDHLRSTQCPACKSMKLELDRILSSGHHSQTEHYLLIALASARESIANLDRANKDLLETLAMRHVDISRVSSEAQNMHNSFMAQSEKMYKLEARMKTLQMEHDNFQEREKSYLLEKSIAMKASESSEEMISKLKSELNTLRPKYSELQEEQKADKQALKSCKEEMINTQKKHNQLNDSLEQKSKTEINALQTELVEVERSYERAKASLANEKAVCDKLRNERDEIRIKFSERDEEFRAVCRDMQEKNTQIADQINDLKDARQNMEILRAQLDEQEATMIANDKTAELSSLKKNLADLSRQLVENNKEIYKSHEELEGELKNSSNMRTRIESLTLTNASLETDLEEAKKTSSELNRMYQQLKDDFIELKDTSIFEKESLQKKIDAAEKTGSTLNSDLGKAEQEITELRMLNEDAFKKNLENVRKTEEAKHEIENLQLKMETEVSKLKREVDDVSRKLKEMETCRDDEVVKRSELEKEVCTLKDSNREFQKSIKSSENNTEKLLRAEKNDMNKQMESRLAAKDDEIARLLRESDVKFKQQSSEHRNQLERSANDVADANRKTKKANDKVSELENIVERMNSKIAELENDKRAINDECIAAKRKVEELKESMKTTADEVVKSNKNIAELEATKVRMDDVMTTLRQQNEKISKDLKQALMNKRDAEGKTIALTIELTSAKESLTNLQGDYQSFREMSRKALKDKNGEETHAIYAEQIARLEELNNQRLKEATESAEKLAIVEGQLRASEITIENLRRDQNIVKDRENEGSFHTNMLSMFGLHSTPSNGKKYVEPPSPAIPGSTYKSPDTSHSLIRTSSGSGNEINSPPRRKEKTHDESVKYIEQRRTSTKYDDLEPKKRPVLQKIRKGIATYFDLNTVKPEDLWKYEKSALLLQRCGRGHIQRHRVRQLLRHIPHSVDIKVGFVADLPPNSDIMSTKPDVFVLINTFRNIGNRNKLYSCAETRKIKATTNPVYEEEFRCASVGKATVVVNVMSSHTMGPPSMIGQALVDLDNYPELFHGSSKQFLISLHEKVHAVYDTTGAELFCDVAANPRGTVDLRIKVPSISSNMCGWFWQIHERVNRFGSLDTTGSKMWIVLRDKKIYLYDNPFKNVLVHKDAIDCDRVLDIQEMEYDKLDLKVQGMKLILENDVQSIEEGRNSTVELYWAWGEDAAKIKGLWRKAIIWHQKAHHEEERKISTKLKVVK